MGHSTLYVNGRERITDCPAVNDGLWHHIGVSWRSEDGDWRVYIDGSPSDGGKGLSMGSIIPGVVPFCAWIPDIYWRNILNYRGVLLYLVVYYDIS